MSLLLEQRGTDPTLNGLNAGVDLHRRPASVRCWRRTGCDGCGIRNFLLACFCLDIAMFLAMKPFDGLAAWFILRARSACRAPSSSRRARRGSTCSPATSAEAASSASTPPRCPPASASARCCCRSPASRAGPPFLANAVITALAMLPLLGIGGAAPASGENAAAVRCACSRARRSILSSSACSACTSRR